MKKFLALSVLLALPVLATAGPGDWVYKGSVAGPVWSNTRIAVDSTNAVYVAGDKSVFKSVDIAAAVAADPLVAPNWTLMIDGNIPDPTNPDPALQHLTGNSAALNTYQGIAVDPTDDSVYFVCDGDATVQGRIDKFSSAGVADGTIADIKITLGDRTGAAQVLSDGNLLIANYTGNILVMDAATGALGAWTDTTSGTFLRDIDLKGDTVLGGLSGSSIAITGGTAADITGYTTVTSIAAGITSTTWDVSCGVEYFAADDSVLVTNFNDRAVYVSDATTNALVQTVDFNDASTDVLIKVSDIAAFSAAGTDYLVATAAAATALYVWTKDTTPPAAVSEWQLLD